MKNLRHAFVALAAVLFIMSMTSCGSQKAVVAAVVTPEGTVDSVNVYDNSVDKGDSVTVYTHMFYTGKYGEKQDSVLLALCTTGEVKDKSSILYKSVVVGVRE